MDDLDFAILEFLYNSQDHKCTEYTLLSQKFDPYNKMRIALKDMRKASDPYIVKCAGESAYQLTEKGIKAYKLEKQSRDKQAKQYADKAAEQRAKATEAEEQQKKQFRHDIIVVTVSAIISSVLTLLVEHFPKLIDAVSRLFL